MDSLERLADVHIALVGLYLRGLSRPLAPSPRRWPEVERLLRREAPCLGLAASVLHQGGFAEESCVLDTPGLLLSAEAAAPRSESVVTAGYPARWRERLHRSAPPAVWRVGPAATGKPPGCDGVRDWVGVVGSRDVPPQGLHLARALGAEAARRGHSILSGGAVGCDREAATGSLAYDGEVVVVLPHGVEAQALPLATACLAVAAPREGFSTGLAMERNALIYAGVELTVVVHARYRAGGSWHGAADALRRRLGRVAVPSPMLHHPGIRALHALGAEALVAPAALAEALGQPPRTLFPPEAFAEAVSASSPLQVAPPLV